jgi:hypothetical protein
VLILEQISSSLGIKMVDLYSLTAPTIARKEAARVSRKAYEKRKTRQGTATREQVAADAEVDPLPDKPFRPLDFFASVDVAPLRGRRSWASPSEAAPAEAPVAAPASAPHMIYGTFCLISLFVYALLVPYGVNVSLAHRPLLLQCPCPIICLYVDKYHSGPKVKNVVFLGLLANNRVADHSWQCYKLSYLTEQATKNSYSLIGVIKAFNEYLLLRGHYLDSAPDPTKLDRTSNIWRET